MRYRLIFPERLQKKKYMPVLEKNLKDITQDWLQEKNEEGYNIYYFPNDSTKSINHNLTAKDVDDFKWVFVDMDLKDGIYKKRSDFIDVIKQFPIAPTKTVDSGHGIHVYWRIIDLDRLSYMQLQKALINQFKTDKSIWTITQLMRAEGFYNTKYEELILCQQVKEHPELNSGNSYKVEELLENLDPISKKDQEDIDIHINKYVFGIEITPLKLQIEALPEKFEKLLENNKEVNDLFYHPKDRSEADIKIANILQIQGYTKEEAYSILSQTNKGQERGHNYVQPLVEKVYNNPLDVLDSLRNELAQLSSIDKYYDELALENKRFEIESKNKKIKDAKESIKFQAKYSLQGFEEELANKYIEDIEKEFELINQSLYFMTSELTKVVQVYGSQFILIGAPSGGGKSSVAANIIKGLIRDGKRVAMLSTEERASAIILRIACLLNDVPFNNKKNWVMNPEIKQKIYTTVKELTLSKQLKIYDSYSEGKDESGNTLKPVEMTTLDGLETVLKDLSTTKDQYDVFIVDYISKIGSSRIDSGMAEWEVIYKAAIIVEEYCKAKNIPGIVFSQLNNARESNNPKDQVDNTFRTRLPGSKRILNLCTLALELKPDYQTRLTTVICHKNRENGNNFIKTIKYNKGHFEDCPQDSDTVETELD